MMMTVVLKRIHFIIVASVIWTGLCLEVESVATTVSQKETLQLKTEPKQRGRYLMQQDWQLLNSRYYPRGQSFFTFPYRPIHSGQNNPFIFNSNFVATLSQGTDRRQRGVLDEISTSSFHVETSKTSNETSLKKTSKESSETASLKSKIPSLTSKTSNLTSTANDTLDNISGREDGGIEIYDDIESRSRKVQGLIFDFRFFFSI